MACVALRVGASSARYQAQLELVTGGRASASVSPFPEKQLNLVVDTLQRISRDIVAIEDELLGGVAAESLEIESAAEQWLTMIDGFLGSLVSTEVLSLVSSGIPSRQNEFEGATRSVTTVLRAARLICAIALNRAQDLDGATEDELDKAKDALLGAEARARLSVVPLEYSEQSWDDLWSEIRANAEG